MKGDKSRQANYEEGVTPRKKVSQGWGDRLRKITAKKTWGRCKEEKETSLASEEGEGTLKFG